jgi:hypothetical protein
MGSRGGFFLFFLILYIMFGQIKTLVSVCQTLGYVYIALKIIKKYGKRKVSDPISNISNDVDYTYIITPEPSISSTNVMSIEPYNEY